MKNLLILGAGRHGRVVGEIAVACGYDEIEYLDDCSGKDVVGSIADIENFKDNYHSFIVGIGNISVGTVVESMALINANTIIGKGCIVSTAAIVNHDVVISDFVHMNTGSICKAGAYAESKRKLEAGEAVHGYTKSVGGMGVEMSYAYC